MRPYETLIILDSELDEAGVQSTLDKALDVVRANGGQIGEVARWGKRTLAYEINHHKDGIYILAEFSAEPKAAFELDRVLHLADEVVRHKIIRLPDVVAARGVSRTAPPPPSVPAAPARSIARDTESPITEEDEATQANVGPVPAELTSSDED
jgi:small subunit ribosomal protein S6